MPPFYPHTRPVAKDLLPFHGRAHDFPLVSLVCPQMQDLIGIFQRQGIFHMFIFSFFRQLGDPITGVSSFDAGLLSNGQFRGKNIVLVGMLSRFRCTGRANDQEEGCG